MSALSAHLVPMVGTLEGARYAGWVFLSRYEGWW